MKETMEMIIGKGRATIWMVLIGLFALAFTGNGPTDEILKLIGYIIMAVTGVEAGLRSD